MRTTWIRSLFAAVCVVGLSPDARAAERYWDHGGGNDLWSNDANWTDSAPASNDVANLANNAPDEAQTIDLDEDVWLAQLDCPATGNRDYTINTANGSTITFLAAFHDIAGSGRTVDLTVNADIYDDASPFYVNLNNQTVTLNGRVGPVPGETCSMSVNGGGVLVLGGSNSVTDIRNLSGSEVRVYHRNALGLGNYRNDTVGGTLSIATNAALFGDLWANPLNLRIIGAGTNDVVLSCHASIDHSALTVLAPAGGSTGHLYIRMVNAVTEAISAAVTLREDSSIVAAGTAQLNIGGGVHGAGDLVVDTTANVYIQNTNDYTGGTVIRNGKLLFILDNGLPADGTVVIEPAGVLDVNGHRQTTGGLSGDGTVDLEGPGLVPGTNVVNGTLAPGLSAGTLTVTGDGAFILGNSSTSQFELDALAGTSDQVVAADANLTLAGTLEVLNLGGLEAGAYTLFDLTNGSISGDFSSILMPPGFAGTVDKSSGDVVLNVTVSAVVHGTVISIR